MHSARVYGVVRPVRWKHPLVAALDVLFGVGAALLVSYFFLRGLF
jgi:hypothetical protein